MSGSSNSNLIVGCFELRYARMLCASVVFKTVVPMSSTYRT